MADPIYGHELLELLTKFPGGATRPELKSLADSRFGADAVYTNCSGMAFDFEGVVAFLASRGKLSLSGEKIHLGPVPGCGTGAHSH